MKKEEKQLHDFTIKGELIGTINLTDTFKKVKEITNHKDAHKFLFIDINREEIPRYEIDSTEEERFPIVVIKLYRRPVEDENLFS